VPTIAQLQTEGSYVSCGSNSIVVNAVLSTTVGTYNAEFKCQASNGCQSEKLDVSYTIRALPGAPTKVADIPNICNGGTQKTIAELEVDGAFVSCAGTPVPKVVSVAPNNTTSSIVTFACIDADGLCTSTSTFDLNAVVQAVVAGPTGAGATTTVAGASGSGTAAIGVCSTAGSGDLTFVGGCAGTTALLVRDASNAIILSAAPYTIPAPSASTTYKLTCRESEPTSCESPTSTTVTFTVTTIPAPIKVKDIAEICDGGTQLTLAAIQTEGNIVSCGAAQIVANAALSNTAGTYSAEFRCLDAATGCQSLPFSVSYTVRALPAAPTKVADIPNICNGGTQKTIAELEVDGAFVSCAGTPVPKVVSAAPSNTTSSIVTFACKDADGLCTSSATFDLNAVVQAVVVGPTAVSATTTVAGASGNSTAAIGVCSTAGSGDLTFTGTCAGTTALLVRNASDNSIVASGPYTIPAPMATTTYKLTCRESEPTACESPTSTTVTFTVTTISAPVKVNDITTICDGGTQPTVAALQTEGSYVNCAPYQIVVNSALATTAGSYTAEFRCLDAVTGCQSTTIYLNYTVTGLPTPVKVADIPNICNGNTPKTIAELEVEGAFVTCAGTPVPKVVSGVPSSTTSSVITFACTEGACVGTSTITLNAVVQAVVTPPTTVTASSTVAGATGNGTASVGVCFNAGAGNLTFAGTCAGTTALLVRKASDNSIVASGPSYIITAPSETTVYNVSCRESEPTACESTSVPVTFTVTTVAKPTLVKGISPICAGQSQPESSVLTTEGTYVSCGSNSIIMNALLANTEGNFTAEFKCLNTATGCQSEPLYVPYVVNRTPSPSATISTAGPICSGIEDVTISYSAGCMATDSVQVWSATSAGVPITQLSSGIFGGTTTYTTKLTNPSSTVPTSFYFVVRCKTALGCSAVSSPVSVSVNAALQVTDASITPAARCANVASTAMFFNSNCGSAVTVWYTQEFGGTPVATLPNMTPTTVGTHTWWAACDNGSGCESPRKKVEFVVYPAGSTPGTGSEVSLTTTTGGATTKVTVTQSTTICGVTGDAITFSGCSTGEILKVRVNGSEVIGMPTIIADGATRNYQVVCEAGTGAAACPSPTSSTMTLTVYPLLTTAPTANVVPAVVCSASAPVAFGGSSNCGALATVWFDATTNTQLLSLPSMTPTTPGTYSYYAKCVNGGGCMSPASATTSLTVVGNSIAPTITSIGGTEVCTGVNVTLTTNCPAGSVVKWSTGDTGNALPLVSAVPQVRAVTAKCVTTVGSTTCESPVSATTTVVWKVFDITIINIGSPLSGVKPGSNVPKSAWAANFVTVDAGPSLQSSSQGNPSVFFTENPNKGADRFWTVHVESCALGTAGAVSYDMLVTPETGVPYSYNTVENNAPYLMYANRDGFTELYAHNHGAYGFTSEPKYTQGLPKGLYKLSIRYWSEKGMGLYPAVRTAQGTQLAYQEYWFRIQSQNGIGSGAAREGVTENTEAPFVTMGQNPVTRTLSLTINGAKGQDVKLNLVDASGRSIKVSSVTPETNTHREEIDMTSQNTGMYFIQVSTPSKRAALKVLKVSQD